MNDNKNYSYDDLNSGARHAEYETCPCCGNRTLDPEDSAFEICPVCFWENDPSQVRYPDETGANDISLNEARKNYAEFGACAERFIDYVRKPLPEEIASEEEGAGDEA